MQGKNTPFDTLLINRAPVFAIGNMFTEIHAIIAQFFNNADIPLGLLVWGSAGQVIFSLRFVYQWVYSRE